MKPRTDNAAADLAEASKDLARQALAIFENRIKLLLVELQEKREQILRAFGLGIGVAVFSLLAGVALTMLVVIACWSWSPVAAPAILLLVYGGVAVYLSGQLTRLRRDW